MAEKKLTQLVQQQKQLTALMQCQSKGADNLTSIKLAYPPAHYCVQDMQVRDALRSVGLAREKAEDSANTNGEPSDTNLVA